MGDERLSAPERDLALLAGQHGGQDAFLIEVIELADRGLTTSVGLLVNGMVVVGVLTPAKTLAQEIDGERARMVRTAREAGPPEGLSEEQFRERLSSFETASTEAVEAAQREREELEDELAATEADTDEDLPAELERRVLKLQPRPFLTLRDVQVVAPGQTGVIRLEALRVAVAQVGAWWPIRLDAEGQAHFQLFRS